MKRKVLVHEILYSSYFGGLVYYITRSFLFLHWLWESCHLPGRLQNFTSSVIWTLSQSVLHYWALYLQWFRLWLLMEFCVWFWYGIKYRVFFIPVLCHNLTKICKEKVPTIFLNTISNEVLNSNFYVWLFQLCPIFWLVGCQLFHWPY